MCTILSPEIFSGILVPVKSCARENFARENECLKCNFRHLDYSLKIFLSEICAVRYFSLHAKVFKYIDALRENVS